MGADSRLNQSRTVLADASGNVTASFPPPDGGWVWQGSLFPTGGVTSTSVWTVMVGNTNWGTYGSSATSQIAIVQAWGSEALTITGSGFTANAAVTFQWTGLEIPEREASHIGPISMSPAVNVIAGGSGAAWADTNTLANVIENLAAGSSSTGDFRTIIVNGVSMNIEFFDFPTAQTIAVNTNFGSAGDDDTRYVVVRFSAGVTINGGVTITTPGRRLGLVVWSTTIANAGTVTMTQRGATAAGQAIQCTTGYAIPAAGAAGGTAGTGNNPGTNATGAGDSGGGGAGSGNIFSGTTGGAGRAGTSASGGTGGGAASDQQNGNGGVINGGAGGPGGASLSGNTGGSGGGAGNPGGARGAWTGTNNGSAGTTGTAGLLVVFATGNVTGAGTFTSAGSAGGSSLGATTGGNEGGGGSGGGSVNIFAKGTIATGTLTVSAPGGAGGVHNNAGADGGAGGTGTARSQPALSS